MGNQKTFHCAEVRLEDFDSGLPLSILQVGAEFSLTDGRRSYDSGEPELELGRVNVLAAWVGEGMRPASGEECAALQRSLRRDRQALERIKGMVEQFIGV